jgi:hypothetical protein
MTEAGPVPVPNEWHELYRSDRQRLVSALMAAMYAFIAAVLLVFGIGIVVGALQRDERVPLLAVPLYAPLGVWLSIRFWKNTVVSVRASRAAPGRIGTANDALVIEDFSLLTQPLVIARDQIETITLPPTKRNAMSFQESRGLPWIKLSLLADSPNCGVFLTAPITAPARYNVIEDSQGWGAEAGTAPPKPDEPFQVIWLRTADWAGARALRSWADSSVRPLAE